MYDIIADLHTHTIASGHGIDTIRTLSEFACRKGLQAIAITDHGPGLPGGAGFIYFLSLKRMTGGVDLPIRIFNGVEDDIKNRKGDLTLPGEVLSELEIVMTGLHPATWIADQPITVRTEAVVNAMRKRFIHVFTHPVGTYYDIDIGAVVEAAAEYGVALELNGSKLNDRSIYRSFLEKCEELNAYIVVNSDAHLGEEVGDFGGAEHLLSEMRFPEHLIINRSRESITSFLKVEW